MIRERFHVYVTKYALTTGIEYRPVDTSHTESMVCDANNRGATYHGEGREWHRTFDGAKARAEQMRIDKIISLRKSIAKMERIDFAKDPAS